MYATVISPNTTPGSSFSHAYCANRMASLAAASLSIAANLSSLASLIVAFITASSITVLSGFRASDVPANICGFCYVSNIVRLCKRLPISDKLPETPRLFGFLQFAIRKLPATSLAINFRFLRIAAISELRITAGVSSACHRRNQVVPRSAGA